MLDSPLIDSSTFVACLEIPVSRREGEAPLRIFHSDLSINRSYAAMMKPAFPDRDQEMFLDRYVPKIDDAEADFCDGKTGPRHSSWVGDAVTVV